MPSYHTTLGRETLLHTGWLLWDIVWIMSNLGLKTHLVAVIISCLRILQGFSFPLELVFSGLRPSLALKKNYLLFLSFIFLKFNNLL